MLKRDRADVDVCAFDNLRRRGSELALGPAQARAASSSCTATCASPTTSPTPARSTCCSNARPSRPCTPATAAAPAYVLQTNLTGTINCLEAARRHGADVIFLSTSRVYPIAGCGRCRSSVSGQRLDLAAAACGAGLVAARHHRRVSARRLPLDVRRDQARLRAADRRIPGDVRPADDRQPLRRDLRSLADGQGRSGIPRAVGGAPSRTAARCHTAASAARALQVRDVLHVADLYDLIRAADRGHRRALGRRLQRRRRPRQQRLARRADRACRARAGHVDCRSVRDAATPATPTCRTTSPTTPRSPRPPAGRRRRRSTRCSTTSSRWLREHRAVLEPVLGAAPRAGARRRS